MATIKERLNNTNGWQRIYIAIVLYVIAATVSELYSAFQYGNLGDKFFVIIGTLIGSLALLYFVGWMIAWIRRGFKNK